MNLKLKTIAITELIIILVLATVICFQLIINNGSRTTAGQEQSYPLLSKKIESGALPEKSYAVTNFAPLRADLEVYIAQSGNNISVYVENLRNGAYMGIDERAGFTPASLSKIPLAILIMKKVEAGQLKLDTPLEIQESDKRDTFGTLYQTKEKTLPLDIVLEKLLRESDNTALNVLLHYVSSEDIDFIQDYYGLDIRLDFPEYEQQNRSHTISAKSLSSLFLSLYYSTVLEARSSSYLLSLMQDTAFDVEELAQLPENVKISHKFGQYELNDTVLFHDCGIMYIDEGRFFYCIMTKGENMDSLLKDTQVIVNHIYQYIDFTRGKNEAFRE